MKSFPSLHSHTHGSILDAIASPSQYFQRCKELEMSAIAFTDHGNLSALAEATIDARNFPEVKPIMGLEAYIIPSVEKMKEARVTQDKEKLKKYRSSYHLILLAKNEVGVKNLVALNNFSWKEGFYFRPRLDLKTILSRKEGLVITSACQGGILSKFILNKQFASARSLAKKMKDELGRNFYIELQLLDMEIQDELNVELIRIGKELDIPFVITNDTHYVYKGQHELQTIMMELASKGSFSYESTENYLKSLKEWEEIRAKRKSISKQTFNSAVDNCLRIAEECNAVIPTGNLYFPEYDHKTHFLYPKFRIEDKKEFFKRMMIARAFALLGEKLNQKVYRNRLQAEYETLLKLGGIDYFLICDDLLNFVRKEGSFSMIRGSANGSLIAFVFQFGMIDPVEHGIMFERFISKYRSLNDIDIDIDVRSEFRSKAVSYLRKKYGEDQVVSVGTYNRMQLKSAIKDITRVLADRSRKAFSSGGMNKAEEVLTKKKIEEYSFRTINNITSVMSGELNIEKAREEYPEFSKWYGRNQDVVENFIRPIVGNIRNVSLHPAGVVILPKGEANLLPVRSQPDPQNKSRRVISTVWENSHTSREDLNEVGVMILDVLGVKTLSIVSEVISLIKETRGEEINLYNLNLKDEKTLEMFNKGELLGVFQFSGGAASKVVELVDISEFNDLIVINAIARPGALIAGADKLFSSRKKDPSKVKYDHPSLKTVLSDSLGVLVFSEHILRTASEFAGMDPKKADNLRKIIKGKNQKAFKEYEKEFISGAVKKWRKITPNIEMIAARVWSKFSEAGGYLFPRGHASSYAFLGFLCQFLKVHYPVEFFTCHLRFSVHEKYAEIKRVAEDVYGVRFTLPRATQPLLNFEATGTSIAWPIAALKHVGGKAAQSIVENAPYSSFDDFYNRVEKRVCNKRVVENLIIAGFFRDFGKKKAVLKKYMQLKKEEFTPHLAFESNANMAVAMEEIFGFETFSLESLFGKKISKFGRMTPYKDFLSGSPEERVQVAGRVLRVSEVTTKNGDLMAFADLKAEDGIFKLTFFPEAYRLAEEYLKKTNVLVVSGKKNVWNKDHSIVFDTSRSKKNPGFTNGHWVMKL